MKRARPTRDLGGTAKAHIGGRKAASEGLREGAGSAVAHWPREWNGERVVFALLFVGGIMVLPGKTEIGIVVDFISGLDRVLDPWRELIAFVRSSSAARVQFDLIEGTLGRKL